jgi:hypothetical protein
MVGKKYTIEECKEFAENKNGKCLSIVYINNNINLLWKCNICNNEWEARFKDVKNKGCWCPRCGTQRATEKLRKKFLLERKKCKVSDCEEFTHAKGYCPKHYYKMYAKKNKEKKKKWGYKYRQTDKHMRAKLLRQYNLKLEDFKKMLKEQNYKCAICKCEEKRSDKQSLSVDHCHVTMKVRGILCSSCNHGLGFF